MYYETLFMRRQCGNLQYLTIRWIKRTNILIVSIGSVVIKNWKPLSFDKIAESPLVTVSDILGELTTVATLRIQIFRYIIQSNIYKNGCRYVYTFVSWTLVF